MHEYFFTFRRIFCIFTWKFIEPLTGILYNFTELYSSKSALLSTTFHQLNLYGLWNCLTPHDVFFLFLFEFWFVFINGNVLFNQIKKIIQIHTQCLFLIDRMMCIFKRNKTISILKNSVQCINLLIIGLQL